MLRNGDINIARLLSWIAIHSLILVLVICWDSLECMGFYSLSF